LKRSDQKYTKHSKSAIVWPWLESQRQSLQPVYDVYYCLVYSGGGWGLGMMKQQQQSELMLIIMIYAKQVIVQNCDYI